MSLLIKVVAKLVYKVMDRFGLAVIGFGSWDGLGSGDGIVKCYIR